MGHPSPLLALLAVLMAAPAAAQTYASHGRCGARNMPLPLDESGPRLILEGELAEPDMLLRLVGAGFRPDPAKKLLFDERGTPMSAARWARLQEPVDITRHELSRSLFTNLMFSHRLDEKTCRILDSDGEPLSTFTVLEWEGSYERSNRAGTVDTLYGELRALPPGEPVPRELVEKYQKVEQAGMRLPENIRKLLFAENPPTVEALRGPVTDAQHALTRFFDGERGLASFEGAARPLTAADAPGRAPRAVTSLEERLSAALGEDYRRIFERNQPGRELLASFKGAGRAMPPIRALKLEPRFEAYGAVYSREGDEVVINHWLLAQAALDAAPAAERPRLSREFSDPAKLATWLLARPAARRKAAESIDASVVHELTHARQADRRFTAELHRGNLPSVLPLANEHEAHREHCRYIVARVSAEKGLAASGYGAGRMTQCSGMLGDYSRFRDNVTDEYRGDFASAQVLEEIEVRQAARRDVSVSLLLQSVGSYADFKLFASKLKGLVYGDAALGEERRIVDRGEAEFRAKLPALRAAFVARVPGEYLAVRKPAAAVFHLNRAGVQGAEADARRVTRAAAAMMKRGDPETTLHDRVFGYADLFDLAKALDLRLDIGDALKRDAAALAAERLADIRDLRGKELEQYLPNVTDWLEALPKDDARRKRLEREIARLRARK